MYRIIFLVILFITTVYSYNKGDVFAGVGSGTVKRFDRNGLLLQSLISPTTNLYTNGMIFDNEANLYVAKYDTGVVSKFNSGGILVNQTFLNTGPLSSCESIAMNAKGEFYIGQASGPKHITHFGPNGNELESFQVTNKSRHVEWVDLAADQCTLLYTYFANIIYRYDVCNHVELSNFATASSPYFGQMKIRENGEVLVVAPSKIHRFDKFGNLVSTHDVDTCNYDDFSCHLYTLSLDPDGTTVWTGDYVHGRIFHLDIETGQLINQFGSFPLNILDGLVIYGEITAAKKVILLNPVSTNLSVGMSVTITVQLHNFISPTNIPISIFVTGANGPIAAVINTDSNGFASFYYFSERAGLDVATATVDNGMTSNVGNINWYWDNCTVGDMRCINNSFYQACSLDAHGKTFWNPIQQCQQGFVCTPVGRYIYCYPPSQSCETCTIGSMRCVDNSTYQMCEPNPGTHSCWGRVQNCQSGLSCHPSGTVIYCY